ncbi:hypothetical protein KKH39_01015 [Patescibacteria group bacterium]|nr:hypothetical protein [Patescibacteria group bacterium]
MGLIKDARNYAIEQINQYGSPAIELFEISEKKALELAKKLNLEIETVLVGIALMDIRLGQALSEGRISEHVAMSVEASRDFLANYNIDEKKKENIINCVAAHHKDVEFTCPEAELCANADSYRFLTPRGIFIYFHLLVSERQVSFLETLAAVEAKMDEKYNILSLEICKNELEENYKMFKKIFAQVREK